MANDNEVKLSVGCRQSCASIISQQNFGARASVGLELESADSSELVAHGYRTLRTCVGRALAPIVIGGDFCPLNLIKFGMIHFVVRGRKVRIVITKFQARGCYL